MTAERRLAKLESALSPKAATLLWLAEAHQFGSLPAYVDWLIDQPISVAPLQRVPEQARAAALLGLPDGMHCEYVLSFGYPADESVLAAPKRAGGRRPLSELVHEERW